MKIIKNYKLVSVSSRSYILSYKSKDFRHLLHKMFPSPLGVIFSLIIVMKRMELVGLEFPSPLGVIFSLIC